MFFHFYDFLISGVTEKNINRNSIHVSNEKHEKIKTALNWDVNFLMFLFVCLSNLPLPHLQWFYFIWLYFFFFVWFWIFVKIKWKNSEKSTVPIYEVRLKEKSGSIKTKKSKNQRTKNHRKLYIFFCSFNKEKRKC